jgi:signal transduction histidine kinase
MHATDRQAEKLLDNVVHDLRQPLGTIEISAYLLNRILPDADVQVCQHLSTIERQIDLAARILSEAAAELCLLRTQPTEAESLAFTKSETAAVT